MKENANHGKNMLKHTAMQTEANLPPFMQHLATLALHQLNTQQHLENMDNPNAFHCLGLSYMK